MSKATDKILGELHGKLAKSMLSALETSDKAGDLLVQFADDLPSEVVDFLVSLQNTNPALLTAVSKFLKDNDITCAIEDNPELSDLEVMLQAKRLKRKSVSNVVPIVSE